MLDMISAVSAQIVMMGLSMAFGYFCYRRRVFGDTAIRELADLTMRYTIPLSIALSFREQFRLERFKDWGESFLLSCLGFFLMILLVTVLFPRRVPDYRQKRLCGLIPNNAIFGLAIAQALLGSEGVFLISAQIVVSNLLLWTYGIGVLSEKPQLRKAILNPAVLGVLAGVVLVLLPFELPTVVLTPLNQLAAVNSPIGMMLAGSYIARIDLLKFLRDPSCYLVGACKLVIGPLLLTPILLALPIDQVVALSVMAGLIAPTGTAAATFAEIDRKSTRLNSSH